MKKVSWFLLVLVAASLTACAPAYYEATYLDYDEPPGHVSVVTNSYGVNDYRVAAHRYSSIEVTLFASQVVANAVFQPIRLIIHDGDFVEVPIMGRHGDIKRAYAHYYRGDLHFDSRRVCSGVHESRFKYDKRWDKGHRYDHINAGPEYDMRGYSLVVRKYQEIRGKKARGLSRIEKSRNGVSEKLGARSRVTAIDKKAHNVVLKKKQIETKKTAKVITPRKKVSGRVAVDSTARLVSAWQSKAAGGASLSEKMPSGDVRSPANKKKFKEKVNSTKKDEINNNQKEIENTSKIEDTHKGRSVVALDKPYKIKDVAGRRGPMKQDKKDYEHVESVALVVDRDPHHIQNGKGRQKMIVK